MSLLIKEILQRGPATSKQIQAETGLSQATVARKLRSMGSELIKLQSGRPPKYAVTRNAFGAGDNLPLAMVDMHGKAKLVAFLRPLAHGGFFIEPANNIPNVLLGLSGDGLYDDLPYFLYDLGPQGFLGRQIAAEMASQSDDFPTDPRHWNTSHIGRYLVSNGDDLSGNFMLGQHALLRRQRKPVAVTEKDYPNLADEVMQGENPGSSAGGEQPKFTAYNGKHSAHVIVKFSPKGTSDIANRSRDILITEYHAMKALRSRNFHTASLRLTEGGGRLFLESLRFDRSGKYGRHAMLSLQAVDAEFTGMGSNWPRVMGKLHNTKLLSLSDVHTAESLWSFGRLINNSDMHLGNLSLAIDDSGFQLLPVYDMCAMGFAPRSGGEVFPYNFTPPNPNITFLRKENFEDIKSMAYDFWERVANDVRISAELKIFLSQGNPVDRM